MSIRRVLLVVPNGLRNNANARAASFAISPATAPDFSIPLTPNGVAITHWACCPDPGPELTAALPDLATELPGSVFHLMPVASLAAAQAWLGTRNLTFYTG